MEHPSITRTLRTGYPNVVSPHNNYFENEIVEGDAIAEDSDDGEKPEE